MSLRGRFFAATYDRQMTKAEKAGLTALRAGLLAQATGRVLEIGGGTGANLAHYGPAVESLTITEPEVPDAEAPRARVADRGARDDGAAGPRRGPSLRGRHVRHGRLDLVLCGVDDQPRALREIRRVLRPRAACSSSSTCVPTDPKLAKKQDRMNGINRLVVCCDCNRPTLDTIREAGFAVTSLEHTTCRRRQASCARPSWGWPLHWQAQQLEFHSSTLTVR